MLANKVPAKTEHVLFYRLESWNDYLMVYARWDNCEDNKLAWFCDERDFRKLAILYLWAWFVQDIAQAAWRRIFRRG